MSIPANKADRITPAYDIKLKRTSVTSTDPSIKDGVLADGEPLYNKQDKTLAIGNNSTSVENLDVVHFIPKALTSVVPYYTAQTNNMVTLKKEDGTAIYEKLKFWTTGNEVCLDFGTATGWEYLDTSTSTWTSLGRTPVASDVATKTIRQRLTITGMSNSERICISHHLTDAQLQSTITVRQAERTFGTISSVESDTDCIYVYCRNVVLESSCYLNVFGG